MRQVHLPRSLAHFTSRFWPLRHSYSPRIQLVCAVAVCVRNSLRGTWCGHYALSLVTVSPVTKGFV